MSLPSQQANAPARHAEADAVHKNPEQVAPAGFVAVGFKVHALTFIRCRCKGEPIIGEVERSASYRLKCGRCGLTRSGVA